ncbi:hypothetical protein [Aneurinibacillus terranovensis]|uniref:hypothetical protein n=1 Tax=Aneurinibacillus terranovensis TaxID=278991 RepID=UPI00040777B4|nr:hypothetical protein [Aneurinibacillus terranovensis]
MNEPLIPRREPQPINYGQFQAHIPGEGKWECFDGFLFAPANDDSERIKALLMLMYQVGFKRMLEILPDESLYELIDAICDFSNHSHDEYIRNHWNEKGFDMMLSYIEYLEQKCKKDYQRGFNDGVKFCEQNGHR